MHTGQRTSVFAASCLAVLGMVMVATAASRPGLGGPGETAEPLGTPRPAIVQEPARAGTLADAFPAPPPPPGNPVRP